MIVELQKVLILILCILISGCAAMGVPYTSNPDTKLQYAASLLEDWGPLHRPLPAEPLIWEAIEIYKKKGNELGLAEGYKIYAFFLYSEAVENWEKHYRKSGFMDKTATFDNRRQKALEYYEMAKNIYIKNNKYDRATGIYFVIGTMHLYEKRKEEACDAYNKSWESHLRFREDDPEATVKMPSGFANFEEYMEAVKKEAGCE